MTVTNAPASGTDMTDNIVEVRNLKVHFPVTEGIVRRETLIDTLDELRAGSVDYYAALRAAYYQDRAVILNKGRLPETSAADDAFDSFE